jgi:cell division protein FtsZ
VLFNFTGSRTVALHELNLAAQVIAEVVDPDAEIIFGTATDPDLGDEIKVTVIATGFTPAESQTLERDQRIRQIRVQAMQNVADTDLPTFLRRTVSLR